MVDGGMPPMTMTDTMEMSNLSVERFGPHVSSTSRPNLASHQSSSLPSTPYIGARTLAEDYRTPSPIVKGAEMTSPRSARSESDTGTRPSARTPFLAGCKYETGMAFSRRRIPYSLGGDRLEIASSTPKKILQPNEEEKLSGDMRELYDRILPSPESEGRRAHFTKKLENILNGQWPGNDIKAHVFGSSGNLLCTTDSDVDICITTPMKALERVCLLAKALAEHGMERVVCVPHAKVPIVKIWDPELKLSCDMNVNNTLALENTRMIKTYVQIDERVRPLAMVIKHWTQRRILNDAALGGTLSSYTWICMIINFLQTRSPPVLPCLHHRPHQSLVDAEGKLSSFADDVETLRGFGNANKESTAQLLFHFFRRYAHEIDFDKHVISVREGRLISKQAKKWHLMQNNRLCVEEPFNIERNLGNTVDDISFRGVHLELRRAFDLLSQANLKECCEQYVFPPIEEKVWSKPEPQPRPVLSRSHSQSGRAGKNGGSGSRGGHTGSRHRAGAQSRRASSAAVTNHVAFKSTIPPQALSSGLGSSNERASGQQIQAQLLREMSYLQAQEAQLRLQLHQREQANIRLQLTAQNQAQVPQARGPIYPHHLNLEGLAQHNKQYSGPMSAPLRNDYPIYSLLSSSRPGQRTVAPSHHSSVRTNPSSPSMATAKLVLPEVRRGLHRSTTTDNNFGTLRSHSQPPGDMRTHAQAARPSQRGPPYLPPQGSMLGFNSLHQLQQAYLQTQQFAELQHAHVFAAMSPSLGSTKADPRGDERNTRHPEYVGYYVDQSPLTRPHNFPSFPPIPANNELSQFSRGVSPNMTRLRSHSSRSPSPSSFASGDKPLSFNSAASAPSNASVSRGSANGIPTRRSGPIIIDGSSETSAEYGTPLESQSAFYALTVSDAASLSEESLLESSRTPPGPISAQEQLDSFSLDQLIDLTPSHSRQNILQFGDFPVRSTGRGGLGSETNKEGLAEMEGLSKLSLQGSSAEIATNGLGINLEEQSCTAPTSVNGHASPPKTQNSIKAIPKLGTSESQPSLNQLPALKPLPLLSPVREVRTPSPTATRSSPVDSSSKSAHTRSISALSGKDLNSSPLSIVTNGGSKASSGQDQEPKVNGKNGSHDTADEGPSNGSKSPVGSRIFSSGWQQTGKKGKRSKSKGSISSLSEFLVEERKGG